MNSEEYARSYNDAMREHDREMTHIEREAHNNGYNSGYLVVKNLKECPLCGGTAHAFKSIRGLCIFTAQCVVCGCNVESDTIEGAITLWNRRYGEARREHSAYRKGQHDVSEHFSFTEM